MGQLRGSREGGKWVGKLVEGKGGGPLIITASTMIAVIFFDLRTCEHLKL